MWKLRLLVRIFFTYGKRRFTFNVFFEFLQTFSKWLNKKSMTEKSISHPNTPKHRKKKHRTLVLNTNIPWWPWSNVLQERSLGVFKCTADVGSPSELGAGKKVSGYRGLEKAYYWVFFSFSSCYWRCFVSFLFLFFVVVLVVLVLVVILVVAVLVLLLVQFRSWWCWQQQQQQHLSNNLFC